MEDTESLVRNYLKKPEIQIMQLATVRDGQPWACTVHFWVDDTMNFYWVSNPETRHSQEIEDGCKAAIAVVVNAIGKPIGIQAEGDAYVVEDQTELTHGVAGWAARHNRPTDLGAKKLYKFTPRLITLFDTQTFPQDPHKEWRL